MESVRRYTSSKTQYNRFVLKDYHGGKTQANTSLLGGDVDAEEAETSKTEEETQVASKDYVSDLQERVESMRRNRLQVRSAASDYAEEFRQYTTRYIFMLLFGEDKTKEFLGEEETIDFSSRENVATLEFMPMKQVKVTAESYFEEKEEVAFSSTGKVTTADGREITFSLDVGMSREFCEYYKEEYDIVQFQQVCDPLVINFDRDVASLSDQKFFFDIDADGAKDKISMLCSGSGYLALDKNNDGKINDGNELFGPQSGNGFQDLAQYDEDGDGWIDEDDSIWNRLKIWCKDENGKDILYTLRDKGVGAICLQNAATQFALNDEENAGKGYIRSTGIFLYENGNVGTVQHLDLVQ